MEEIRRKYPIGIQTFSRIINEGYTYVDKTDLVWRLQDYATFVFLSRPRRFGKSLLSSTLHSYFDGDRRLFEGLKIMELEREWQQYPVIHLDLSAAKAQRDADALQQRLMLILKPFTRTYGRDEEEQTPGALLAGLIARAHEQTGKQVAVIIDEYDAPLLEVLHEDSQLLPMREVMQELYSPLKACEHMIKFCFITGITKFSQLSIFSTINNLTNVTMDPAFATICGITEHELTTRLASDIRLLAQSYDETEQQMHERLKLQYDGYHFSQGAEEVYNPFSLFKAFKHQNVASYWFESGTPSYLVRQLRHYNTNITQVDALEVPAAAFDQPTENMSSALPLLYQSGYLTIKGYDRHTELYTLTIPNQEVRVGYTYGLLPAYTGLVDYEVQTGFAVKFWQALRDGDIERAMQEMKAYMASIPYVEGFKKKLAEAATAEGFYEYTMYLIFSMLNVYVRTQVKCAGGRVDMVVWMPDVTYVFELKTDGTARQALEQIDSRSYALPFQTEGRRVVKVGVKFDPATRIPESWVIQ